MSSQHNEADAAADQPAPTPGAAGQASAASQSSSPGPSRPGPGVPGPNGPEPGALASASRGASGLPSSGPAALSGPLPSGRNPWKEVAGGRTVFRHVGPIVIWWIWVVFALFSLIQIVIPDHDYFSLEFAAGLLAVTGIVYSTALRPRVFATPDGIEVQNPVQDHLIRWGALNGVYLGDAVELSCARPAPRKDGTIYCWALYSGRRRRLKSQEIGVRSWSRMSSKTAVANESAVQDTAQLIAAELGRRSTKAREAGAVAATLQSRWAWLPIAFICIPAAALLALVLAK